MAPSQVSNDSTLLDFMVLEDYLVFHFKRNKVVLGHVPGSLQDLFQFTFIYILSMTLIFAAEKEAEAARAKPTKATASPKKTRRNEQGNYARFDSCASNLASILN
jgi:hypothetical protein